MTDRRYWIAVASQRHVEAAVKSGLMVFGPGRDSEASRPAKGDWIAYYAPGETMDNDSPLRRFTAMAQIDDTAPESREISDGGRAMSRKATYYGDASADVYDLLDDFSFVQDKSHWGVHFHRSLFEVTKDDMLAIARKMGVDGRKL
ncbi:EVE domain-containing protein [Maribius pontilimi]|uniref:EVE domain-containing protein n=1 Tax=Palleronia pontilimi TaxID=1964209 RepID=A0A934IJR8_9RHOB|nr:EVE domain-containing protein [Palleronia pontilimi]MBJ3763229.1 EVE domain-containing protein [Palleronia pontilimi]